MEKMWMLKMLLERLPYISLLGQVIENTNIWKNKLEKTQFAWKTQSTMHQLANSNNMNWNLGSPEVVKYLIDNEADVDAKTNAGETALHKASWNGNWKYEYLENKYKTKLMQMNWIWM